MRPNAQRWRGAWADRLARRDSEGAWEAFLVEHRRLILATIGHLLRDPDDRMDAFALVCERLREDDLRRLRHFHDDGPARFTTWLVTVVRNIAVDWVRQLHGRRRPSKALATLDDSESRIFTVLAGTGLSYGEAYELLKSHDGFDGTFHDFLRAVRHLFQHVLERAGPLARELIGVDPGAELGTSASAPRESGYDAERAMALLADLPEDVQAAVLLFAVDEVPADQVATIVGWKGPKTVYNRVYRALALLRERMERPVSNSPAPSRVMKETRLAMVPTRMRVRDET